jgi:hypothetical protein
MILCDFLSTISPSRQLWDWNEIEKNINNMFFSFAFLLSGTQTQNAIWMWSGFNVKLTTPSASYCRSRQARPSLISPEYNPHHQHNFSCIDLLLMHLLYILYCVQQFEVTTLCKCVCWKGILGWQRGFEHKLPGWFFSWTSVFIRTFPWVSILVGTPRRHCPSCVA